MVLFVTDLINKSRLTLEDLPYKNAFIIGIFQLFAILPGISRSGLTIFGGILTGLKKESAVKYSLLLSIFAILGAAAASAPDIFTSSVFVATPLQCLLGMAASAISGVIAIRFLLKMLGGGKFKFFAFYCWAVGISTILISFGVI